MIGINNMGLNEMYLKTKSFLKRIICLTVLSGVMFSVNGFAAVISRPVGKEEKTIVNNEIYTQNQTTLRSLFAHSGGTVSNITQDGYPVIRFSPSEDAVKGAVWLGPGYFRNPETEETLGLTNRNYKYAKLKMEIKLEDAGAFDNLAVNFGYVPTTSNGINADFTYFGRYVKNNEEIDKYVKGTTGWQTVEIPVSLFKSTITNKYCIPGTDSWQYELLNWSRFNLVGIMIDKDAESRGFSIRNISLSYPEFLGCRVEYEMIDEDSSALNTLQAAAGKEIYGSVKYKNDKTTDETIIVMLLEYKDDKMVKINSHTFTAAAKTEGDWQTPEFIKADELGGTEIRMFVWDYTDGMRSAGPAKILR